MLRLSDNLNLPLDFVTERIAFLARTGAGKSGGMRVLFEQIFDAGQFGVFIDPKGDAWGIRAAGIAKGKPILVMGGDHGDVPLEATAGKVIAEFLVRERVSTVLDVSDFGKADMVRFVTDLARTLYQRNRDVMHIFIDEADMVAGEKFYDPKCLEAIQLIQNKGRHRGFGVTIATQRSAMINKSVLFASGTLIAMQTTSPKDISVVREWLEVCSTKEIAKEVVAALPTLKTREAIVYSPQMLPEPVRITFSEFQTFDSMRTPKPGEARQQPKSLAEIDLSAIQRDMAETIEKAKADDPKLLKAEILKLKREVEQAQKAIPQAVAEAATAVHTFTETVEVPVLDQEALARLDTALSEFYSKRSEELKTFLATIREAAMQCDTVRTGPLHDVLYELRNAEPKLTSGLKSPAPTQTRPKYKTIPVETAFASGQVSMDSFINRPRPAAHVEILDRLSQPQRKLLNVLASFEPLGLESLSKSNLAVLADVSPKSSSFANNLGALRNTSGTLGAGPLIEYVAGGHVKLTDTGRNFADGNAFSASTNRELLDAWCGKLSGPQGKILRVLFDAHVTHAAVTRTTLADAVEASIRSSSFANNLGALRSLGLIDYGGGTGDDKAVSVTDLLFPFGSVSYSRSTRSWPPGRVL